VHAVLTVVHTAAHTYRTHASACREKSNCVASLTVLSIDRSRAYTYIALSSGGHTSNASAVGNLPLQSGSGARVDNIERDGSDERP
jgi:hypothetical protein